MTLPTSSDFYLKPFCQEKKTRQPFLRWIAGRKGVNLPLSMNQGESKALYRHAVNPNSRKMRKQRAYNRKLANFQIGHEAKKGYASPTFAHNWQSRNAKQDCPPCRGTGEVVIMVGRQEHRQECQRCKGFGWLEQ